MKPAVSLFLFFILSIGNLKSQDIDYTQYYLNLASVNSGFTGIEDYVDMKFAARQGWNNFGIKNNASYLSIYGTIKNSNLLPLKNSSMRLSNPAYFKKIISNKELRRKQGIGGMISNRDVGLYKSVSIVASYAYHLPVSRRLNWSFGSKAGYVNQRINFNGYTVRDEINDTFYQQLIHANQGSESLLVADFGSVLYSNNFYLAVSSSNLLLKRIGGFNLLQSDQPVKYSFQMGANLKIGSNFVLNPGVRIVTSSGYELSWVVNSKLRYKDLIYLGVAYQNNVKTSVLLGIHLNNVYSINYAYDQYLPPLNNFNVGVHEIVFGIAMRNKYGLKAKFW